MEELSIIIFCLVLNGLVACFEMALVTVSRLELRQRARKKDVQAEKALLLREHPERTLSILQILITLVGALSAAVGGVGAKESLAPYFATTLNLSENWADVLAILCVVIPLTYFSVVLGELVPKAIALRFPMTVTLWGAPWVQAVGALLSPFVNFLTFSTRLVMKIFLPRHRVETTAESAPPVQMEFLTQQQQQYVLNLVAIETKKIRDAMVYWSQVNRVNINYGIEEIAAEVYRSGHTRLPVCDREDVIGILHTKEFLAYLATGETNWRSIIRPFLRVPEKQSLLKTLLMMQENRSHMGIVFSSSSELLGIVTLEDIIEEVVGDIYDEDDDGKIRRILASKPKLRVSQPT